MVILIIVILATLAIPLMKGFREKAEKVKCISNLKNLHVASEAFIQDNKSWPQITFTQGLSEKYSTEWIHALSPYGVTRNIWVCPTIQRQLSNPSYAKDSEARVDYFSTPFDSNEHTPYKWTRQPWFIERGDVHGHGNLVIFADGSVIEAGNLVP